MDDGTADQPHEPTSRNLSKADSHEGSFLRRPAAVVVALIGAAAAIVLATAAIVVAISGIEKPSSQDKADAAVKTCKANHGLQHDHEKNETAGLIVFRQCSWPPPHGADADGYAEIQVTSAAGPGRDEAEGMTAADTIHSKCRDTELVYFFSSQGTFAQEQPILLSKGEIRRVEGGSIWFPGSDGEAAAFTPGRDESIILANGRYHLDTAQCV